MDSSNAEKAARAAYIAFHEGLSGFDAARAWDDMTSPADDWSQEAIDWTYAVKAALSSRDAEVAELTRLLAESRARFGDSEARRAELEAVIEKVRERLVTLQTNSIRGGWASRAAESILRDCLSTTRSVVLEDRDREVAARALEAAADKWLHGAWGNTPRHRDRIQDRMAATQYAGDWLRDRAAAIRKGDTNA